MRTFVRALVALALSALLAACGNPLATAPAPTTAPPTATPAPRPRATAAPAPTSAPAAAGALKLGSDTPARWDWRQPGTAIQLPIGASYNYRGENDTGWCRLSLANGAAPWVLCSQIGVTPPSAPAAPALPAAPAFAEQAAPAEAAPPAPEVELSEDERAQRDAQPGPAPRDLPPDVAAAPACMGPTGIPSPMCGGRTNGDIEQLAREAEARGDYVEAARLRNWLPQ